jgi:hypothetical protein
MMEGEAHDTEAGGNVYFHWINTDAKVGEDNLKFDFDIFCLVLWMSGRDDDTAKAFECRLQQYHLLDYAASNWDSHFAACPENRDDLQKLVLNWLSSTLKFEAMRYTKKVTENGPSTITHDALHCCILPQERD